MKSCFGEKFKFCCDSLGKGRQHLKMSFRRDGSVTGESSDEEELLARKGMLCS